MGRKPTNDPNLFAKRVFDKLLDKLDPEATAEQPEPQAKGKDPKAVKAGREGGLKGGKARAKTLTARKRKQIAKQAASARWSKKS